MKQNSIRISFKSLAAILFIVILIFSYWLTTEDTGLLLFFEQNNIKSLVDSVGFWGPGFIIALMVIAIVLSPFPSAPIALASGAAYGHTAGTIYIVIGSELGAILAFLIARNLGKDYLHHRFGSQLSFGLLGSQNYLMGVVFLSRLMPFISFDLMSYAAGVTNLSFMRFVLATLAGIIPASFLLAHFGSKLMTGADSVILPLTLFLSVVVIVPIALKYYQFKKQKAAD